MRFISDVRSKAVEIASASKLGILNLNLKMNREQHNQTFYWSLVALDLATLIVNLTTSLMFIKFRGRLLVSTHNRILFSMALADALVGVFGFNLGLFLYLKEKPLYYKLAGNIPMFSSLFGSVLALALLTIDRLVAVKKPFTYSSHWYRRLITRLLIVLSWGVPATITVIQSLIYVYMSSKSELVLRSIMFSAFFCFAAFVLIIFNAFLIASIRTHFSKANTRVIPTHNATSIQTAYETDHANVEISCNFNVKNETVLDITRGPVSIAMNIPNAEHRKIRRINRRSELKQTSIFCVAIISLFVILWAPLAIYRLYYALGVSLNIFWLRRLALCLTVANSLLNPVFYFLAKRELRRYLLKFFHLSL